MNMEYLSSHQAVTTCGAARLPQFEQPCQPLVILSILPQREICGEKLKPMMYEGITKEW